MWVSDCTLASCMGMRSWVPSPERNSKDRVEIEIEIEVERARGRETEAVIQREIKK